MLTPQRIIDLFDLKPLRPEGGYYSETYRSDETLPSDALPDRYSGVRVLGTAVYYLLTPDTFSAMHRLNSDEVYHFYLGDPVEMLQLFPDGSSKVVRLGHNILQEEKLQHIVKRRVWQGGRLVRGGRFALVGTTMGPGFDRADYEQGERGSLIAAYPGARELITALTR